MAQKKAEPIKVILLGDSAVGKTKYVLFLRTCKYITNRLVERFLMEDFKPITQSTYALTLFQYKANVDGEIIDVGTVLQIVPLIM